jgi:hypothetical protein
MLDEPRLLAAHPWVTRRPITVTEYHRMGEVGILGDRDRVELIEGELVAMSPIGSYHHGTVNKRPMRSCRRSASALSFRCKAQFGSTNSASRSRTSRCSSRGRTFTRTPTLGLPMS